jgi:hypothetical protein
MEKTSHWAALYFVALMTFGNYVLFNLLVAILVEGFSAEVCSSKVRMLIAKSRDVNSRKCFVSSCQLHLHVIHPVFTDETLVTQSYKYNRDVWYAGSER